MSKDFWMHLGVQIGVAAAQAIVTVLAGVDWSHMGNYGPFIAIAVQGVSAVVAEAVAGTKGGGK